jgi:hypothetical protein
MNERIRELADQSGFILHKVDGLPDFYIFNKEKFAELIVRECAKQCLSDDSMRILNHMGVKGVE